MRKYIGTKLIEAEKIVRVDGKMQPVEWPIPSENAKVEHGYKVRYADGYESFSPKDVFEKAYMPLEHNKKLKTDAPSISQKMVEDFIAEVHVDTLGEKTTVVRAVLANGFEIVESSSCVSKENYDQNLGKDICMEKIVGKVWYLLGFLLQTAVNGVDLPRIVEPERNLEQEYQDQMEGEQHCEACDSSCCGCDAAEEVCKSADTETCEEDIPCGPGNDCCECAGETGCEAEQGEAVSEGKTDNKDCAPPKDKRREVDIHIVDDGNGIDISVAGTGIACVMALERAYVAAVSLTVKDAPGFLRETMMNGMLKNLDRKVRDAVTGKEKEEEAK